MASTTKAKKSTSKKWLFIRTDDILFELIIKVPSGLAALAFLIVVLDMWTGWFFTYN